ncbi:hypothetical protein RHSIM_Rhsim04G0193000 [Rhododendron simsii]|uniref:PGG domain-containing protein n=1 Tax=Rhododendron simsii TaxID=118357 RepID=A0A834H1U5_RHOSS|nr:hypothetical protein RHSIM_Rhsim04G0193000 [Rhododendron simsii]
MDAMGAGGLQWQRNKSTSKAFVVKDAMAMIFSTIALFITLVVGEISDRDKLMKHYASDRFLTIIAMEAMVLAFIESIYSVFAHSFGPVMINLCFGGCFCFPV